ncbi:MAG TPA: FmdB family zinc ribbon protein [Thermoanaerobaculia bacterium]|nr:FmdB family zinc ribbon protein [Thermoanaerobaculia bacterium]
MPIYEYQCNDCRERHEIIQKISDDPLTVCPKCGGGMKKLISSPAIQFKGSGFYKTDYASGSSSKPAESKSETKAETKSESKSESSSNKSSE